LRQQKPIFYKFKYLLFYICGSMDRFYYLEKLKEEKEQLYILLFIVFGFLALFFFRNMWNWYQKRRYRNKYKVLNVAFDNLNHIADELEENETESFKKIKGLSTLIKELKNSKLATIRDFKKKERELNERRLMDKEKYKHELENFNYERLFYKERIKHNEVQASNTRLGAHFLKNVLFGIQKEYENQSKHKFSFFGKTILIEEKKKKALLPSEILPKLNRLLDYNVSTINERKISLSEEVDHIKVFLEIITFLKPKLKISHNLNDNYDIFKISPTLLFPFVENALKHGDSNSDTSFLQLDLSVLENSLSYQVTNSAFNTKSEKTHQNFGLESLEKALKTYYKEYDLDCNLNTNQFIATLKVTL